MRATKPHGFSPALLPPPPRRAVGVVPAQRSGGATFETGTPRNRGSSIATIPARCLAGPAAGSAGGPAQGISTVIMLELLGSVAVAGLVGWSVTDLLVPLVARFARFIGALDVPGGRKQHDAPVPRLGGLAIAAGVVLGVCPMIALTLSNQWRSMLDMDVTMALLFIFGTSLVFLLGLVDDLSDVPAGRKLLVETLAAWFVVSAGWRFEVIALPRIGYVDLGVFGVILTVIWIVGVTNAINFIDGLDGLAGGVVAIIAGSLAVCSIMVENALSAVLMGAIFGSCLGFLRHNWNGKVFMGDAGSLTLGFILGVSTVHASLKTSAAVAILVPILTLGVPVIDTVFVMLIRYFRQTEGHAGRRFSAMFQADRNHLHHLLEAFGGRKVAVVTIYVVVLAFSAMAILAVVSKSFAMGMALILVQLVAILLMRSLGFAARIKEINLAKIAEAGGSRFKGIAAPWNRHNGVDADRPDVATGPGEAREPVSSSGREQNPGAPE